MTEAEVFFSVIFKFRLRKFNKTVWFKKKCRHKAQISRTVTSPISRGFQLVNYDNSLSKINNETCYDVYMYTVLKDTYLSVRQS